MRIKITLLPEEYKSLNINYNYFLSGWVYNTLKKANREFAEHLHEKGYRYGKKVFKLFTFSQLRSKKLKIIDDEIMFLDETYLYITSPKKEFMLNFVTEVLNNEFLKLQDYQFRIKSVEMLKEPEFSNKEDKFICLSPIVMSTAIEIDGKRKSINLPLHDSRFIENIKNNLIEKYYVLYNTLPDNLNINIDFDVNYYMKNPNGKRIKFKNVYVKGYMVPFTMSGNPDLIKVAYECGLGEKNSAGFGMIQKIK
ncbi:CRISPR-associated protein Cas6 [Thermoanaerobacterium thermosaccharolyticum DSM 571]|uniref:CRISPR-associated endoribonuclease n=1 Tax=Thermoanaerobacterium thermosaccharolyticum (strain ATCC 7956 / DSM 571 / NCIMB 9385 / NCA 3814 / NCTC 13789 / WDCM 00135 / 2032) TaxID=580327 RepID=D9TPC3_THETC|nr:CRISPR-associated endoribonuclease Cas6 [Thermoanaerobacterium thermosaccharolyticum]ADL70145.1 CRISPR-associated protein Cas6 [Thermoanaerobacterium thermosaccharolyticum DSM 571]TCW32635.1 CRISPR-associated Cas6 family protein [Thermohydrogenium kirishiense]